jgi:hypothetical protein
LGRKLGAVPEQPSAFDLFPREVLEESQADWKICFGPSLKLEKVEGSLGSVETTIHIPKVEPAVITFGVGGANLGTFRKHRRHLIVGSRIVYAIIAYPLIAKQMTVSMNLEATIRAGRFGLRSENVPQADLPHLIQVIP